jgi:ABC-type sugar transport system ATPase subunit
MALLEVRGVRKAYPGVTALAGVDLAVAAGEVHALLGENGAGKSTLMKVIAGSVVPDAGHVAVGGRPHPPRPPPAPPPPAGHPTAARERGIATVYQELSLVPALSIGENVQLGRWPRTRAGTIDWDRLHATAADRLRRVGLAADPRTRARALGIADRQLVEIAKALGEGVQVLLLDEPTSALSDPEAVRLFGIVRELTAAGVGVVYVSHVLSEVLEIADRITVLRDGRTVAVVRAAEVTESQLAEMMVGRKLSERPARVDSARTDGEVALRLRGLACPPRLMPVDLELRSGEVAGFFGLVGAGRTRLARAVSGLEPGVTGTVEVFGRPLRVGSPPDAVAAGLGFLGDDRALGVVPKMSVAENITLASLGRLGRGPLVDRRRQHAVARRYVDELAIQPPALDRDAGTLSGGNQQKVVLARWLCSGCRVLVLDDATRGIDVGAKEEVFRLVRRLAGEGMAILYFTSEIKEAKTLCDRVFVMAGGRVVRHVPPDTPDDEIMAAAGGVHG